MIILSITLLIFAYVVTYAMTRNVKDASFAFMGFLSVALILVYSMVGGI